MKRARILLILLAVLTVVIVVGFFGFAPSYIARHFNEVTNKPPYAVSDKTRALHEKLFIADLHADSLIWNYDLNERQTANQVDVPRLLEGNVALQAFTVVTKTPRGLNIETNDDRSDNIFGSLWHSANRSKIFGV